MELLIFWKCIVRGKRFLSEFEMIIKEVRLYLGIDGEEVLV